MAATRMVRGRGALPPAVQTSSRRTAKRFSFHAGVDFVTSYIARGVAFSNAPSYQPYFSFGIALPELTTTMVKHVKMIFGNWNSFQDGDPGLGQSNYGSWKGWYEADLYGGVAVTLDNGWSGSFAYYFFHSPAHSFDDYGNLEWTVSYDDTGHWRGVVPLRKFALEPRVRITRDVSRSDGRTALYVEPSLTPSFDLGSPHMPVRIGFPLAIGISNTYYTGIHGGHPAFGYFRTGVDIAAKLAKTANYAWSLKAGVSVWLPNHVVASGLGGTTAVARIGTSLSY